MTYLREPLWPGPYHPSWIGLCPGDWVMWVMPDFVKVGQVDYVQGISIVIHFQGHPQNTIIPDGYQYWDPTPSDPIPVHTLTRTVRPKHLIEAPKSSSQMTVKQAAAFLGTQPKEIRRMLRAGQLKGRREAGSWVEVTLDGLLSARQVADSPATD